MFIQAFWKLDPNTYIWQIQTEVQPCLSQILNTSEISHLFLIYLWDLPTGDDEADAKDEDTRTDADATGYLQSLLSNDTCLHCITQGYR